MEDFVQETEQSKAKAGNRGQEKAGKENYLWIENPFYRIHIVQIKVGFGYKLHKATDEIKPSISVFILKQNAEENRASHGNSDSCFEIFTQKKDLLPVKKH